MSLISIKIVDDVIVAFVDVTSEKSVLFLDYRAYLTERRKAEDRQAANQFGE